MALTRPTVIPTWADTGDKTQPTSPEIETGWPVTNIPPSRQRFNWFFNWVSNAIRYFSRRGLSDWKNDESYEIGDRCISPVDQKTYKSKIGAGGNVNFEPSTSPTQWERWGFTLFELSSFVNGGVCPNTGPVAAPTLANPYTEYTSSMGEKWKWTAGAWCVVSKHYGITVLSGTQTTFGGGVALRTETVPRSGYINVSGSAAVASIGSGFAGPAFAIAIGSFEVAHATDQFIALAADFGYKISCSKSRVQVTAGEVITWTIAPSAASTNSGKTTLTNFAYQYVD